MHGYPYRRSFRPSGHYGDGEQIAIDAFKTGAAASVAGGAAVASTLAITAAGVVTVPVAGWVAGAVLGTAAGIAALVVAIQKGKARRKDAVALAKKLKLPNPEKAPGYIVRALKLKRATRVKIFARYKERIARLSKQKSPIFAKARAKRIATLKWKLSILSALARIENPKKLTAKDRKALRLVGTAPSVPPSEAVNEINSPSMDLEQEDAAEAQAEAAAERTADEQGTSLFTGGSPLAAIPTWGWAVGGGVALVLVTLALRRGGRDQRSR